MPRLLLAALVLTLTAGSLSADDDEPAPLRVMSFNIRYGTAQDGKNHWDRRREFVAEVIRDFNPDLLGTQETLKFQKEYLAEQLPGYEPFGVGRDDGTDRGEMAAVFYRRDRFERLEGGHFWLSESPEVPGSLSWDSSLTRICSWVKLRDRRSPDRPVVWFFNTHFDHRGAQARTESARLLRRRIIEQCGDDPVIVTGDFNAAEGSEPYKALFGPLEGRPSPVFDAYRRAHPEPAAEEGTFNGFKPDARSGNRIDWIAVRGLQVESADIDRTIRDGRTPSDHWPVTAVLAPE